MTGITISQTLVIMTIFCDRYLHSDTIIFKNFVLLVVYSSTWTSIYSSDIIVLHLFLNRGFTMLNNVFNMYYVEKHCKTFKENGNSLINLISNVREGYANFRDENYMKFGYLHEFTHVKWNEVKCVFFKCMVWATNFSYISKYVAFFLFLWEK